MHSAHEEWEAHENATAQTFLEVQILSLSNDSFAFDLCTAELLKRHSHCARVLRSRAGSGSMGHGSVGQMGHFLGWVTWVIIMGQCMLTHDPPLFNQPKSHSKI